MSTWSLGPELRPASKPPHPLVALFTTLHNELAPHGWEVWSYIDGIEVTCPCGQQVAVTTDNSTGTRRWTLTPESERAGTVVLTDLNGLSSADHVSRILGFLCSRHTDDAATVVQG
ncbi:hypothetical protein [Streptomyces longwoodensis]|uniref:hypothetical protein n=1 Tax=Streptomyces longwoodensis TaxID=68231 RepID=UPI0033F61F45